MAVITCTTRKYITDADRVIGECDKHEGDWVHTARYEGKVLGTWEHNGYHDSDFYALVWDGEGLRGVEYASTRGWTYHNGAKADATDEVKAAAREWLFARDVKSWAMATAFDAVSVEKGKRVEVVKGRKVAIGTTGEVIWIGADRYQRDAYRVGIKDDAGEVHWTAETNVKALDAGQYLTGLGEITETTRSRVDRLDESGWDWVSAYRSRGGTLNLTALGRTDDAKAIVDTDAIEAAIAAASAATV